MKTKKKLMIARIKMIQSKKNEILKSKTKR